MQVKTQLDDLQNYLTDASNMRGGHAAKLFIPESAEEIAQMEQTDSTYAPAADLTIFEAVDFRNRLVTLLSQEGPVAVDLSTVHQIDSSCIQILLAARRSGRLTVTGVSEQLRLKATQLGCPELVGH